MIAALTSKAKSLWEGVVSSLGVADFGTGPFWDGVDEWAEGFKAMAWQFIAANLPMGRIGGGPIDLSSIPGDILGVAQAGLEQMGWGDQFDALNNLIQHESGWDPWAENPDSGAYGIPQINPSAHGYPAAPGDAVGQIEWMLGYIAERYGDPQTAWDHWQAYGSYARGGVAGYAPGTMYSASNSTLYQNTNPAGTAGYRTLHPSRGKPSSGEHTGHNHASGRSMSNGGVLGLFHRGGVVPGVGNIPAVVEAGERVLTARQNAKFESLVHSASVWRAGDGNTAAPDDLNTGGIETRLEAIEQAIDRGTQKNPSAEELQGAFVAGALAALASEAGKEITGGHLLEKVKHFKAMQGSVT
jgi:hypothetical protein